MNVAQADINTFLAAAEDLQIKGLTQKETKNNKEIFDQDESERGRLDISNKGLSEEGNFEIKSEPSLCQYNDEASNKERELSVSTDHKMENLQGYQSTGFNEEEYHDEHGNGIIYIKSSMMSYNNFCLVQN